LSCTKPCCSQASQSSIEHVFVETCDDLIAKENDQLIQEVERLKGDLSKLKGMSQVQPCQDNQDNMVKKLEKGSNRTSSTFRPKKQGINHKAQEIKKKELDHIQSFKCSNKGHYASMCSPQLKNNKKRQGKLRRRICYKCKQHGHFIGDCPQVTGALSVPNRSDRFGKPVRPVLETVAPQVHIKHNQASTTSPQIKKEQVSKNKCKASSRKIKSRLCYTCRSKGHESNECPNGNIPKSKLVNNAFSRLRDDKNEIYATRVISSPQTSIRTIWIPKSIVTNLKGPNMAWVPKGAC
jgi:hypothetical protein